MTLITRITTNLTGRNLKMNLRAISGKGKGHSSGTAKATDTAKATNSATSAGNRGQKRKNDMRQQDDAALEGQDENPPVKKGKALPSVETRPRPVPRPLKKKGFEVAQGEEANQEMDPSDRRNAKKRPSEAADMAYPEDDPKTPVSSKRAKVGLNEKAKDKPIPIRRTGEPFFFSGQTKLIKEKLETMIRLVGSKVYTQRPTDRYEEDADDEEAKQYNDDPDQPTDTEDVEIEPYHTPIALTPVNGKKNRSKARELVEDTEAESSDVEVVEQEKKKRRWAPTSAADKVRSSELV
jgi:hypothetical protein